MAVFYYPDRGSPSSTVTITRLEYYNSERIIQPLQSVDILAGGDINSYNLGGDIQFIPIKIRLLSSSNRTQLLTFIQTTINFREKSFDFTDDQGNDYDTCYFFDSKLSLIQTHANFFSSEILLRLGPT